MTAIERVEAAASALKVFPLPTAVLFPGTVLPLHVFEPRYRELMRDCLAGDKVMAVAQLEPGWEEHYEGRPKMRAIGCAGMVVWHEQLTDGRYNVVVDGACRIQIVRELAPTKSYREVEATLLVEEPYSGEEEHLLRQGLLELATRMPARVAQRLVEAAARRKGGALADAVAAVVVSDVQRRVELLSELDVRRRLAAVIQELGSLIARLTPLKREGPLN